MKTKFKTEVTLRENLSGDAIANQSLNFEQTFSKNILKIKILKMYFSKILVFEKIHPV